MKKQVIVTTSWDDGHKLDLKLAKLLKKYRIKGTFYISPENREFKKSDLLSNEEIVTLSKDFEIGAHTMTHPRLTEISEEQAVKEIVESKKCLEKLVNKDIKCFCYPGGNYNSTHVRQIKNAGLQLARTTETFALGLGNKPYELSTSIHIYDHWSDVWKVLLFVRFNPINFWRCYHHWDILATKMFNDVLQNGGVFHLWGHSWEIEKNGQWGKLEEFLNYLSQKNGVIYCANSGLLM